MTVFLSALPSTTKDTRRAMPGADAILGAPIMGEQAAERELSLAARGQAERATVWEIMVQDIVVLGVEVKGV
jgi:hypothetical protein